LQKSTFVCKTITPMLSRSMYSKIENSWRFELRPQSIKGVMRFWFRALVPCVVDPNWLNGSKKAFSALHYLEGLMFGSQEKKSPFSLTVSYADDIEESVDTLVNSNDKFFRNALFGTYELRGNNPSFSYMMPDQSFTIRIRYSSSVLPIQKALTDSLMTLISNYSGFGAKARDGFGSFSITKAKGAEEESVGKQPSTSESLLLKMIREIDLDGDVFRLVHEERNLSPYEFPTIARSKEMTALANSTSWRRNIIRSLTGLRNMDGEPQTIYSNLKLVKLRGYRQEDDNLNPMRAAYFSNIAPSRDFVMRTSIMGLPIIYQKFGEYPGTTGRGAATISNNDSGSGRKASPIFVSVHKAVNNTYFARILLMASKISPERDSHDRPVIYARVNNRSYPILGNENFEELWNLIEGVIQ